MARLREGRKMVQISLNVSPDTQEVLRSLARHRGIMLSSLLRMVVVEWLQQEMPDWQPGQGDVLERRHQDSERLERSAG